MAHLVASQSKGMNSSSRSGIISWFFRPIQYAVSIFCFELPWLRGSRYVFQGTSSMDPSVSDRNWRTYEFKCKPGDPQRRPCLISPYHYRFISSFALCQMIKSLKWHVDTSTNYLQHSPPLYFLSHLMYFSTPSNHTSSSRLDWLMWFAAFQYPFENQWLIRFAIKLIENDQDVSSLIADNPFINGTHWYAWQ